MQRRTLVILGLGLAAGMFEPASLAPPLSAQGAAGGHLALVDTTETPGIALRGYDPVAYVSEGRPRKGLPGFRLRHAGVDWHFASEANRLAFTANPDRYAPAYGGHCAWAVAQGHLATGDPLAWRIEKGRLYLNYDLAVKAEWEKDMAGNISRADGNWPGIGRKP